jgi:hypothetical protein
LEELYPRRCCDSDDAEITKCIPSPKIIRFAESCPLCCHNRLKSSSVDAATAAASPHFSDHELTCRSRQPVKITSHVVSRSFKPVLGFFFGLPGSKQFRSVCERWTRDLSVRNCGPSFLLQQAIAEAIGQDVLDRPFVRTEDLNTADVVAHVAPPGQQNGKNKKPQQNWPRLRR